MSEKCSLVDGITIKIIEEGKSYDFNPEGLIGVGITAEGKDGEEAESYALKVMIGGYLSEAGVAGGLVHLLHGLGAILGYKFISKVVYEFAYDCHKKGVLEDVSEDFKTKANGDLQ